MSTRRRTWLYYLLAAAGALLLCTGCPGLIFYGLLGETVEKTEWQAPAPKPEDELTDDRLEDKTPVPFEPALADREPHGGYLVNRSDAVIRLDIAPTDPGQEAALLTLHPSYTAAAAIASSDRTVLPSVNLIDGKAKQFDDGLYAALDQAYYQGLDGTLRSHVELVRRIYDKLDPDSAAAPFLAAALELAGVRVPVRDTAAKDRWLRDFEANEVVSKPIGFYTWNGTLSACFRFLRFLQHSFTAQELAIPATVEQVLGRDAALSADYRKAIDFYAKLTNPPITGDMALFPASTSREVVLFDRLFPEGLPANAQLMSELVRRIRSGSVKLEPRPNSGWYEFQVYALETLLVPEKGEEHDKLLLTRPYKKRMLEAFEALFTKRRETHVRQLQVGCASSTTRALREEEKVRPRLRLEPCPSYFLRTARAYAFLSNFLEAAVGKDALHTLHGLTKDGRREQDLSGQLSFMRDLFYGLYLVSAEDIGMKPALMADEPVDREQCYKTATEWLSRAFQDPDLGADTRVAVPIFVDLGRPATRLWATLGVRLAKLDVAFARPPRLKPLDGGREWDTAPSYRLGEAHYLIPVDEFVEVELQGLKVLDRDELRTVCDRERSKEAIVAALQGQGRAPAGARYSWAWGIGLGTAAAALAAVLIYLLVRKSRARPGSRAGIE
jgi:hypothetical protein